METAIKKAIEGGYGREEWKELIKLPPNELKLYQYDEIFGLEARNYHLLCTHFWQALGKQQGWRPESFSARIHKIDNSNIRTVPQHIPTWQAYMYCFIDHIAEGKSIDEFFEQLLGKE